MSSADSTNSKIVLVAEDNPDEAFILRMMCKRAKVPHSLHIVDDGQQAIDWLSGTGAYTDRKSHPMPHILVLDLKMPVKTGLEVLEWARKQPTLQALPIVILTSSDLPSDMQRAQQLGATKYLVKSSQLNEIVEYLREA